MSLPDFDVFLESIDKDALEAFINGKGENQLIFVDNLFAEGNLNELVNLLYQKSAQGAANICLAYLLAYHQWLQRQLEQNPDYPNEQG